MKLGMTGGKFREDVRKWIILYYNKEFGLFSVKVMGEN